MRDLAIGTFLDRLAERSPIPASGVVAALQVAQAGALIAMVARFSSSPGRPAGDVEASDSAEEPDRLVSLTEEADELRRESLEAADQDVASFAVVAAAYTLAWSSVAERKKRSEQIRDGLLGATAAPLRVIALADRLVRLAEELRPRANRNLLADLVAALDVAAAAATISRLNVQANVLNVPDSSARRDILSAVGQVDDVLRRVGELSAAVRDTLGV